MNAMNTNERSKDSAVRKSKFWSVLKKGLLYTIAAIAAMIGLVVVYQIFKLLLVAALLLIAWGGVVPRRWR